MWLEQMMYSCVKIQFQKLVFITMSDSFVVRFQ